MEIILHIGSPKTGSSALQQGLLANEHALSAQGIIHSTGGKPDHKASALIAGIRDWQDLPRHMRHTYRKNPTAANIHYQQWLSNLKNKISDTGVRKVIISNEYLFALMPEVALAKLRQTLEELGGTVTIVAYLRKPSEFYLSSLQQRVRASATLTQVKAPPYRKVLERYKAHIPGTIRVFAYDRSAWPNRDILRHFASQFIPEVGELSSVDAHIVNESISIEGIKILMDYRKLFHSKQDDVFTADTRILVRALKQADQEIPRGTPSCLRPEIAENLDYTCTELIWLKEEYGVEFKEIEYDRIKEPSTSEDQRPSNIADIAAIDQERLQQVQLHVMHSLSSKVSEARKT